MPALKSISDLVERFDRNLDAYRSPAYNETQLRREFLDPFFRALGWDIDNEQGYAEAYKDVIHEDAIKVGEGTKAPDYCFRIGGTRKFFLEAKRPAVDIKHNVEPAFQLRRYAWTTKLPLGVLSDFEEFAVYDCRVKPDQKDNASVARILYLRYTAYLQRWDEVAAIFSRDAVLKGSFDKFAESNKAKRGTADVDDEFLRTIEGWRADLARNLALRNPQLTQPEINFAVQRTIDRIIFLRICEGRGIEDYGRLRALSNGPHIYGRLCELFEQADTRYNSGIFHFRPEKERHEIPDELTLSLEIDDKLLRAILNSIYYPESPYVFSALPADILGQVYEQFLGKVIRLTEGHHAVIEEKPEVKKAGGVYYTPTYIVDYIVQNTVDRLLEGKTPTQASKLKILDPACGSGSFLLGAYEHLLKWHLAYYTKNNPLKWAKGSKPALVQVSGGNWKLTIAERKRILVDNIYGVDIDAQAVETTKLSLLLKVLEGETQQSLQPLLKMFQERALPDLGDNIKCGNSLISPDFFQQQDLPLLTDEERHRINVFNWRTEFPQVFGSTISSDELRESAAASPLDYSTPGVPLHGYFAKKNKAEKAVAVPERAAPASEFGFDAVIGNPPYILLQILDQRPVFEYFAKHYRTAKYKIDTYHLFIEKGLLLVRSGGKLGYITPNTFLRNKHAKELRAFILEHADVDQLRLFYYPVFRGASVDTSVIIITPTPKPGARHRVEVIRSNTPDERLVPERQLQSNWSKHPEHHFSLPGAAGSDELAGKIVAKSCLLGDFATAYFGIQTFDRKTFVNPRREGKHFKPALDGIHIQRYKLLPGTEFVDFRPEAIKSGGKEAVYEQERIGVRQIGEVPIATLLPPGLYSLNTIYNIFFTRPAGYDLRFCLAVICSKALQWYWKKSFYDQKETFPKVKKDALLSIPVPRIMFSEPAEKSGHDKTAKLVQEMLDLQKRYSLAKTPQEQTSLGRQIAATDAQIDHLVYELYGLTEEEIKMIEASEQ